MRTQHSLGAGMYYLQHATELSKGLDPLLEHDAIEWTVFSEHEEHRGAQGGEQEPTFGSNVLRTKSSNALPLLGLANRHCCPILRPPIVKRGTRLCKGHESAAIRPLFETNVILSRIGSF